MVMVTDGTFFPISPDPLKVGMSYSMKSWRSHGDSDWLYFFPYFSQSILSWNWLWSLGSWWWWRMVLFFPISPDPLKVGMSYSMKSWQSHGDSDWLYFFPYFSQSILSWNWLQYEVLAVNHKVMTDCTFCPYFPWSALSWNRLQYELLAVHHKVMTDCTFFPWSTLSWNQLQYEVLAINHMVVMADCTFFPWSTLSWNQLQYEVLAINHMVVMTDCAMQDVAP